MIGKAIKYGAIGLGGLVLAGGFLFGGDAMSYLRSSALSVQTAVKDSVPIEFELKRARDTLDEILPEMHAHVRLIAQEEVEVAGLKSDIGQATTSLAAERVKVGQLRDMLNVQKANYVIGGSAYSREQVSQELARQFDRYKEAEMVLAGKRRLLETREKSLQAAVAMLERSRSQKVRLEDQIESLEGQYRLVKAASVGSTANLDNSKLAQTEKLINELKKRLDVAERVLAHEARFVQPMLTDTVNETDLVTQVDDYFAEENHATVASQQTPSSQPAQSVVMGMQ